MPGALAVKVDSTDQVGEYVTSMQQAGLATGRSTVIAAKSFRAKLQRAGGWDQLTPARQADAIDKARSYASWLFVTSRLSVSAELLGRLDLRLGNAARTHCPDGYSWFLDACKPLDISVSDVSLQWNTLVKITAITGVAPQRVHAPDFEDARTALIDAYNARGMPCSGRNIAAIFHHLQLTLFHAGALNSHARPARREPVSVTGWATAPEAFADTARRYVAQIELSLRPATVKHIEHDLREFGVWLGQTQPGVGSCADLQRGHIEDYKSWVGTKQGRYTGKPLNRVSIKNRLINLHCFFDRITEWGYPQPPQRPLIFGGDLPIVDKPLPGSSMTPPRPSSCAHPAPAPTRYRG